MRRRGFLGMLFGAPAAVIASKVKAAPVEELEPVVEASDDWEPEDDYGDGLCATCVPTSRLGDDFLYRHKVK